MIRTKLKGVNVHCEAVLCTSQLRSAKPKISE